MHHRLCLLILLASLWSGCIVAAEESLPETLPVQIATETVRINEVVVDSRLSKYPLLTYNDITYLPLTWEMCGFLGLNSLWDRTDGLCLSRGVTRPYQPAEVRLNQPGFTYQAEILSFAVTILGETVQTDGEYPWLMFRQIVYMPLTWENVVGRLDWKLSWDQRQGLSLHSRQSGATDRDLHGHLTALLNSTLLNEYHFTAGYMDQLEELWLHGEVRQEYPGSSVKEAGTLRLTVECDSLFWHHHREIFSSFSWSVPLDLSKAAEYSQQGGRLPEYEQETSFAQYPLVQFPLLMLRESVRDTAARWQATAQDGLYRLELQTQGGIGLQCVEMTLSQEDEVVQKLELQGSWPDDEDVIRYYKLFITFREVPLAEQRTWSTANGSSFLEPVLLEDGGIIMFSSGGDIARTNRRGEIVWSYAAEPQLLGHAQDEAGNIYVWSYQNLWCLSPYGNLVWQRSMAVRSLAVINGRLLVSQQIGEQIQWELLNAANGRRSFLFPPESKQVKWGDNYWICISDQWLEAYNIYGEARWQTALPTPQGGSQAMFGWQYSLLAAENGWIVVHQQGINSNKIFLFDSGGSFVAELPGFGSATQAQIVSDGVYLYQAGQLSRWSPNGGLQLLHEQLAAAPLLLAQGGFLARNTWRAPYESVQRVAARGENLWQAQLAWAAQHSGPYLIKPNRLAVLSGRSLASFDLDGTLVWQLQLDDLRQLPAHLVSGNSERTVIWNSSEILVVDALGRLRWSYRL